MVPGEIVVTSVQVLSPVGAVTPTAVMVSLVRPNNRTVYRRVKSGRPLRSTPTLERDIYAFRRHPGLLCRSRRKLNCVHDGAEDTSTVKKSVESFLPKLITSSDRLIIRGSFGHSAR
jgi:hypothetical protein